MKARFDDIEVELTDRFVSALEEVLQAECEMMVPDEPEIWFWGRARIVDLSRADGIEFTYGAIEDMPPDGLSRFAVVAA